MGRANSSCRRRRRSSWSRCSVRRPRRVSRFVVLNRLPSRCGPQVRKEKNVKPSSMLKPQAALALLAAEVALSGCFGEPTKLASETTGDLSNPRAERARFDEEVVASCGAGQAIDWVGRKPYLQQVSSTSAEVVFTTESTGELLVDVSTPEGAAVQTLPATVDDSVGANQRFVR